ncbi:MAG TPA: TIM barrel protein [Spirochaetia bacterium]|nr:TIM barrel protein [Spirochaetia bacterium]
MRFYLGVKSDPIESRYSFEWLFDLMNGCGVHRLQMGSSSPVYFAGDDYFRGLRRTAEKKGVQITSMFSSHRDLGFGHRDPTLEESTRRGWERFIHVCSVVGAQSVGSNASLVMRDQPDTREPGLRMFIQQMKSLLETARQSGLQALTVEPMSSVYELPSTPEDIRRICGELDAWHAAHPDTTVPLQLCGDISHGLADADGTVTHDNWSLFEMQVPWMREFHFKNTDSIFNSTFGFGPEERKKGIVDLGRLRALVLAHAGRFPCSELTGYLEIAGPKVGREYADRHLERMLVESLQALTAVFTDGEKLS